MKSIRQPACPPAWLRWADRRVIKAALAGAAVMASLLACRAAADLVAPPTATATLTPVPATSTATHTPAPVEDAACRSVLDEVLASALRGSEPDAPDSPDVEAPEIRFLAAYIVQGDQIGTPELLPVPDDLTDEQEDTQSHLRIWEYFSALIPAQERWMLTRFIVFTDGPENLLGGVVQAGAPDLWALEMDLRDAAEPFSLTYTLIHEFGHLLTLNAEQVPPSEDMFKSPENDTVYEREAAACDQFFSGEGCSLPDSLLNRFFDAFWTGIYGEWLRIDLLEDGETYKERMREFHARHEDRFVTEYASTNPKEDIAEAWAFFVLSPRPDAGNEADRKLLFFYEYPDLVELRAAILGSLCEAFPSP